MEKRGCRERWLFEINEINPERSFQGGGGSGLEGRNKGQEGRVQGERNE